MRLWAWGQSDPGRKRERNEDAYLVDPEVGVMAVADGMGGHQGGATASRMAVEYLGRELSEARGNFEKALMVQIQAAARVTEEMAAVSDTDEQEAVGPRDVHRRALAPTLSPNPAKGDEIATRPTPPSGMEITLPAGTMPVFTPALELMRGVVRRASSAIFEAAWAKPELRGMGTTLTAVLVNEG